MTDEIRTRANQLYKLITDTAAQEQIIEEMMQHCDSTVTIEVDCVGAITLKVKVDEVFDALVFIKDKLAQKREAYEDAYREL